jgi:3-keto-disaccharide hydrolase
MPSIRPDDPRVATTGAGAVRPGTALATAQEVMARLFDPDLVDLTVGAPPTEPSWAHDSSTAAGSHPRAPRDGFRWLFNGAEHGQWARAGAGDFVVVDDRLESVPGDDLGLFWCTLPTPADFVLRLEWLRWRDEDTSGVFVRFPRPRACADGNPAFSAIYHGFKVQLDEIGLPGAAAIHRTGAFFGEPAQRLRPAIVRPPAEWNQLEITVRSQHYMVRLNGELVSALDNLESERGRASTARAPSYIGLQTSPGSRVAFRRIAIKAL